MNLKSIEELIENNELKKYILEIIKYEHTQLHKEQPRYKELYNNVVEEAANEIYKD